MRWKLLNRPSGDFWDRVEDLRGRILRCAVYIGVGAMAGWCLRSPLLALLRRPAEVGAARVGIQHLPFRVFDPIGGFIVACQIALLAGVIFAAPLMIWELWRFFQPLLGEGRRRWAFIVVPFASLSFLGGVVFCYFVSPSAFSYLFRIDQTLGVGVERTLQPYLWFVMRLMLAFGLAFELPLVLMVLGRLGVVNARQLLLWWRHALVLILIFSAVVTVTGDAVNMIVLAVPMFALYMGSIVLVGLVQRPRPEPPPEPPEAPPPDDTTIPPPDPDPTFRMYQEARAAEQEAEEFYAGAREEPPLPEEPPPDAG